MKVLGSTQFFNLPTEWLISKYVLASHARTCQPCSFALTRQHMVSEHPMGMITVLSGKWEGIEAEVGENFEKQISRNLGIVHSASL